MSDYEKVVKAGELKSGKYAGVIVCASCGRKNSKRSGYKKLKEYAGQYNGFCCKDCCGNAVSLVANRNTVYTVLDGNHAGWFGVSVADEETQAALERAKELAASADLTMILPDKKQ